MKPTRPSESWPRLTETLTTLCSPVPPRCLNCGTDKQTSIWQEHDHLDQPEHRYLWLCGKCSDILIEPHVRLYAQRTDNIPAPGVMKICVGCIHRGQGRCACPKATANGGTGIKIMTAKPLVAMVDGTRNGRRCGWREVTYFHPPSACSGRDPAV